LQTSATSNDDPLYVVEVLLYCSKSGKKLAGGEAPVPCKTDDKGEMQVSFTLCFVLFLFVIHFCGINFF